MRVAVVVQRFGAEILGGAEILARRLALRLAERHEVDVFTTCARDYLTWRNELPSGTSRDGPLWVHRFEVEEERDPGAFGRFSDRLFADGGTREDELTWLRMNGPYAPSLVAALEAGLRPGRPSSTADGRRSYDLVIGFCFRYWTTFEAMRRAGSRALLVPTAEDDPVLDLSVMADLFGKVGGLLYLTPEERDLVQARTGARGTPSIVGGAGIDPPPQLDRAAFARRFRLPDTYVAYVGRLDENKGCGELFEFYPAFTEFKRCEVPLVLAGRKVVEPPDHPLVRYVGALGDQEVWEALAGAALLVLPSRLESLSLVLLEAWSVGTPALVHGDCAVTRGHVLRARGGLYYRGFREFAECLARLLRDADLRRALGEGGRRYVEETYRWSRVLGELEAFMATLLRRAGNGRCR